MHYEIDWKKQWFELTKYMMIQFIFLEIGLILGTLIIRVLLSGFSSIDFYMKITLLFGFSIPILLILAGFFSLLVVLFIKPYKVLVENGHISGKESLWKSASIPLNEITELTHQEAYGIKFTIVNCGRCEKVYVCSCLKEYDSLISFLKKQIA